LKSNDRINPCVQLKNVLLQVEKPARYVGGEFGQIQKSSSVLNMAIAFPDLYEIGMSNQALKILYKHLNDINGVSCERVFAPAPDFEAELENVRVPLFTLETGIPLNSLDILGFTLGYELGITGMLSIMKAGYIPLLSSNRNEEHPIVLLGGPAASNPVPFSSFVDGVWIGEAEDDFFSLIEDIVEMKRTAISKQDILERIRKSPSLWIPGKKTIRSMDRRFSEKAADACVYPIPNMKIIQDHGAVEIMRGCPNGCRFCHAGIWYRPMRQKTIETIEKEVELFVKRGGYREISLSSLSSGDYSEISPLVIRLNEKYKKQNISFQLPSLKVSTFSLPVLETISEVRKSGLTFAIETPVDAWQLSINKEVSIDNVVSILREAKLRGWKQAKFYFMIGLPVHPECDTSEELQIIEFLKKIKKAVNISININIGTFVPKPHTPFQWSSQIREVESSQKLKFIREALKDSGFKVSTHDSFVSTLEGLISRGDERIGVLILKAFEQGCRLDAWEDHIRKDIWRTLIESEGADLIEELHVERSLDSSLPWDDINAGVGKKYLKNEYVKSIARKLTSPCSRDCGNSCGVCHDGITVNNADAYDVHELIDEKLSTKVLSVDIPREAFTRRIMFSFSKKNRAIFWPHLSLVEIFSKAFVRASLPVKYSEGFNPLPKLDFASPLSLGIQADNEIATIDVAEDIQVDAFLSVINAALPTDLCVLQAMSFIIPEGVKKVSAAAILWGYSYSYNGIAYTHSTHEDKAFRDRLKSEVQRLPSGLIRSNVFAKNSINEPISYFEAFEELYKEVSQI